MRKIPFLCHFDVFEAFKRQRLNAAHGLQKKGMMKIENRYSKLSWIINQF
jgi:hypothetical protein